MSIVCFLVSTLCKSCFQSIFSEENRSCSQLLLQRKNNLQEIRIVLDHIMRNPMKPPILSATFEARIERRGFQKQTLDLHCILDAHDIFQTVCSGWLAENRCEMLRKLIESLIWPPHWNFTAFPLNNPSAFRKCTSLNSQLLEWCDVTSQWSVFRKTLWPHASRSIEEWRFPFRIDFVMLYFPEYHVIWASCQIIWAEPTHRHNRDSLKYS